MFLMAALLFRVEAKVRRDNKFEFMTSSQCALVACHPSGGHLVIIGVGIPIARD